MNLAKGMRTHYCGELSEAQVGEQVAVCGWADRRREHGEHLAFVDLRDHTGIIQCVVDEKTDVRSEYVLRIVGTLRGRPEDTANPNLATGQVEIGDCEVEILSRAETPPFSLSSSSTEETTRLRHRYVDMRSARMQQNLRTRAKVNSALREAMEAQGFVEIETPMLIASTPEGARDFVVPSRLHPGCFYALPQSPQLFKQLCMVGGVDRYYQIARCLRDEDLRADRQFEFMQLDLEASFVGQTEVLEFVSAGVVAATKTVVGEELDAATETELGNIPVISWEEAMNRFGTDKPDMRFGMELVELTHLFAKTEAKVFQAECIKGFNVKDGASMSRNRIDDLTEKTQSWGAKGLAWFRVTAADGDAAESSALQMEGALARFMSDTEQFAVLETLEAEAGDLLLLVADKRPLVNRVLGNLRLEVGLPLLEAEPEANSDAFSDNKHSLKYVWVVEFPLFEGISDNGTPIPAHHPFTMVNPDDLPKLADLQAQLAAGKTPDEAEITTIRSQAYDLVLNGWELGSGSVRIGDPDLQQQIFAILGIPEAEAKERFGFLLEAFRYGVPPHAGFAVGIDRLVAILLNQETIREVIAFPKTQSGNDPLTSAPTEIGSRHLKELSLRVVAD